MFDHLSDKLDLTHYRHLLSIVVTVFLFAAIPLTVFLALRARQVQTPAAEPPTESYFIEPNNLVPLRVRQVCPLLTLPNDGNIKGQDGGNSILSDGKSFWTFGDTVKTNGGFDTNNLAMSTDLDASDCITMAHRQVGGYATEVLPEDRGHFRPEHSVWPDGMVQVSPGTTYFYYASGGADFGDSRGAGLAKFSNSTWNTAFAQRINGVFWEKGNQDLNGDGQSNFGVEGASAFVKDGFVYLFFNLKLGRVPVSDIETFGKYEYWNGSAWTNDVRTAVELWQGDYVNGIGVAYNSFLGKYTAIYSDTFNNINGRVEANFKNYVRTADSITGPWGNPTVLETCSLKYKIAPGGFLLCYAGRQHPEYDKNSGQTIYTTTAVQDENTADPIGGRLYLNEVVFGSAINQWDFGSNQKRYQVDGQSVSGGTQKGIVFYASKFAGYGFVPIKEWYSSTNQEYQYQQNSPGAGFIDKGVIFYAPTAADKGLVPVYRWDKASDNKSHIYSPMNLTDLGYHRGPKVFYGKVTKTISPSASALDLLNNPEKIGQVTKNTKAYQVSSHNKAGSNLDASGGGDSSYYLYQEVGKYVLLDEKGPGTVNRIWATYINEGGLAPAGNINLQFYFDGESVPRFDMSLNDFFSGSKSPFLAPFVGNYRVNSGGNVSYLPLQFAESLKIVTTAYPSFYYNIGFEKYSPWEAISTTVGDEDLTNAASKWKNPGQDPKPTVGNNVTSGTADILNGAKKTVFEANMNGSINGIKLTLPQIVEAPVKNLDVYDDARIFGSGSTVEFTVKVDPTNNGVRLKRRLDTVVVNQAADVYVDDVKLAAPWRETVSADSTNRWRDSFYNIPASNSANKHYLKIKLVTTAIWTDYNYWVYSLNGNSEKLTDQLDVADSSIAPTSEGSHLYTSPGGLSATLKSHYPPVVEDSSKPGSQAKSKDILTKTRIKIYWENETTASVDAPLGAFFGSYSEASFTQSLYFGQNPKDGSFYFYYPMPFNSRARVELVNNSGHDITGLTYTISRNFNSFANSKFKAKFNSEVPTTPGKDYELLNVDGSGRVVANIMYMHGLRYVSDSARQYLEGDERIYLDQSKTPDIYGTGTEDYFNSGWYYNRGFVNKPYSGYNLSSLEGSYPNTLINTGSYRTYTTDPINFRSGIKMGIEHGDPAFLDWINTDSVWPADYYSLVFWYEDSNDQLIKTDEIDVGNGVSEASHTYSAVGASATTTSTFHYEGDLDRNETDKPPVSITDSHNTASGLIQFQMAINPENSGVILRRRSDQNIGKQQVEVKINGLSIGLWYASGNNTSKRWRDDEFFIPASVTAGQINLTVNLVPIGSSWDAATYTVYSLQENKYTAEYFANPDFTGPKVTRVESGHLNIDWKGNSPDPQIGTDNFSAKFTTTSNFEAVVYRFSLLADDSAKVFLDNSTTPFLENSNTRKMKAVAVLMTKGSHKIRIEYKEGTGNARIKFRFDKAYECPDANGDWALNTGDVAIVTISTNTVAGVYPEDLNGDGKINSGDVLRAANSFGVICD